MNKTTTAQGATAGVDLDKLRAEFEGIVRGDTNLSRSPSGDYLAIATAFKWHGFVLARQAAPEAPTGYKLVPLEPRPECCDERKDGSQECCAGICQHLAPATQQAGASVERALLERAHRVLSCAAIVQIRDGEKTWEDIGNYLASPAATQQAGAAVDPMDEVISMTRRQYLADRNECFRLGEMEGRDSAVASPAATTASASECHPWCGYLGVECDYPACEADRNGCSPAPGQGAAPEDVIAIAARIFDFKPHKQTEETKAKYLQFAAALSQQGAAQAKSVPEKAMFWFSCLTKCARLLDLPDDEPIPSGVVDAVEKLVAAQAAHAGATVLSALRNGVDLKEPVNISKAVLAQREADVCLSGGTGPVACAMLVNIQLTPWADGPEKAEAFVSGYNTAMKWYRAALLDLAENRAAIAANTSLEKK